MKKRRELDALVNGKLGRNKKKKGQHELLRNSESSDVEEFAIPNKPIRIRKHSRSSRLCATCLSACGCFLLLACMIAIVGLVWVHLELKKDVDFLRSQLQKVESGSASNPDEFQELHRKQQELEESIQEIKSGKTGVEAHEANISLIFKKLQILNGTTKGLVKSIGTYSEQQDLPGKVDVLTKQIAGFGSDINSMKASIDELNTFKTSTETALEALQASKQENDDSAREGSDIPPAVLASINILSGNIEAMNNTANTKYQEVMAQIRKHSRDLERLNSSLLNVQGQLQSLPTTSPDEVSQTSTQVQQLISEAVEQLRQTTATKQDLQILQNQVQNISSSLQLISTQHDSLTGSSSGVTSTDLEQLRSDMNQCCTTCKESMKSFNTTLLALKSQISSTNDSGSTGTEGSSTTASISSQSATVTPPPPQSSTTEENSQSRETETPLKVAARDLHKSSVVGREGENDQHDDVSEILKKAIEESGDH